MAFADFPHLSALIDKWILDFAAHHKMLSVLHEMNCTVTGDIWGSGVPHPRVMCSVLHFMLETRDVKNYQDAVEMVEQLFTACGRSVIPYKLYDKIQTGLKIMVLFGKLTEGSLSNTALIALLNQYFPRIAQDETLVSKKVIEARFRFRKLFLSLLIDKPYQEAYIKSRHQKEYGSQKFHDSLQTLVASFTQKVEQRLPVPFLSKLLTREADTEYSKMLTQIPSVAMEILLDYTHNQEMLDEVQLLELIHTLHPSEPTNHSSAHIRLSLSSSESDSLSAGDLKPGTKRKRLTIQSDTECEKTTSDDSVVSPRSEGGQGYTHDASTGDSPNSSSHRWNENQCVEVIPTPPTSRISGALTRSKVTDTSPMAEVAEKGDISEGNMNNNNRLSLRSDKDQADVSSSPILSYYTCDSHMSSPALMTRPLVVESPPDIFHIPMETANTSVGEKVDSDMVDDSDQDDTTASTVVSIAGTPVKLINQSGRNISVPELAVHLKSPHIKPCIVKLQEHKDMQWEGTASFYS